LDICLEFREGVEKRRAGSPTQPTTCYSKSGFIGLHSCPFIYILSTAAFEIEWQNGEVLTETRRPI
jgi:hypothetical protein